LIGETKNKLKASTRTAHVDEIAEDLEPENELPQPVLGPAAYIRVEERKINRVFYFLSLVTVLCLGALLLRPTMDIDIAVFSIWSGGCAFSQHLLASAYRAKSGSRG
jgi:hypothetical protein